MTREDTEDAAQRELVERDTQLAHLARAIDQARDGGGTVISVHGAAGTGRSRLLAAAAARAHDADLQVLSATGRELERDFSFGVAFQLLEPAWLAGAIDRPDRRHEGAPDLMALLGSTQALGADNGTDRFATVHRLFALIRELALGGAAGGRAGLAIVVDDAHRADRPSLELLAYLAARISDLPIALVAAVCDGAPGHDDPGLRALDHAVPRVALRTSELSMHAVGTLVRGAIPGADAGLCDACATTTAGIPFLLIELLSEARRIGVDDHDGAERIARLCPPAVVRRVRERLTELPAAATRLVDALVAIGEPAPVQRAAAVAQLDSALAAGAAGPLAVAGLLRPGIPLAPASPLIAAAIRASIPAAEWEHLKHRATEHHRPLWTIDDHGALWPAHETVSAAPSPSAQQPGPTPAQRLAVAQMMVQGSIWAQDRPQIRHLARLAWGDGSLLDGPNPDAALATLLADALLLTDDLELCLEIVGHPWFSTAERDAPGLRARAGSCRAWSLYHQGRVPTALAEAQAISTILALDRPSTAHSIAGALAACRLQRGEIREAAAALAMLERPEELTDLALGVLLDVRAQLRLVESRPQDALRDALEAGVRL
ncbi:MAG: AAA family ATPase, partial [Solirubrobacteraceae bacterium]